MKLRVSGVGGRSLVTCDTLVSLTHDNMFDEGHKRSGGEADALSVAS